MVLDFVKNDHKDFVAACLARSQEVPLTVHLDLKHGNYRSYPDCTCMDDLPVGMQVDWANPCRYHTTIHPLNSLRHTQRIRTLDVHITLLRGDLPGDEYFQDVLNDFEFFTLPLPIVESLNFRVTHRLDNPYLDLPDDLFCWKVSPPTRLRHLTLHGCYAGPILAVRGLTSFELVGDPKELTELDHTLLLFISGNPSLVSLSFAHCAFAYPPVSPQVAPIELPELKSLRLIDTNTLSPFPDLIHAPALESLSSLRISAQVMELDEPGFWYTRKVVMDSNYSMIPLMMAG